MRRVGRLVVLLWLVGASAALPSTYGERIARVPQLPSDAADRECRALLAILSNPQAGPASGRGPMLDALRDACVDALSWTHDTVLAVAESAVEARRLTESEVPKPLVHSLRLLGYCHHYRTRTSLARDYYQQAVDAARKWLGRGTDDEDLAVALELLSSAYLDLGDIETGLVIVGESVRLRRAAQPYRPAKLVRSLNARARLEQPVDLRRAKATWQEALEISRDLGEEHRTLAGRMASNLGEVSYELGELKVAMDYLEEAADLRSYDPKTGRPVKQLAATQHLLAQVLHDLGDYPRSLELYRQAIPGFRRWLGEEPYRYADALSGYATVLEESGDWEQALDKQLEALAIRERYVREHATASSREPAHELKLLLARTLTRLGMILHHRGDDEAESMFVRALAIQDAELGDRPSADRATTLLELARWVEARGELERARALSARSLDELKAIATDNPRLVDASDLAARVTESADVGLRLIEEGLTRSRRLYGDDNPQTARLMLTRARLARRKGRVDQAIRDAIEAHRRSAEHVAAMVQAFPHDQALAFASDQRRSLDLALDLLVSDSADRQRHVSSVWQAAIASRRLVLDAEIERQQVLKATEEPGLRSLAQALIDARRRYAYLLVQTYGRIEGFAARLEEARDQVVAAEAALAKRTRFVVGAKRRYVDIEDLRQRLPAGASLVGLLLYNSQDTGDRACLAMVLTSADIQVVDLGDASALDTLIKSWRESLVTSGSDRGVARLRDVGTTLRRAIWDPIADLLGPPGTVFLVPDGATHLVPWSALPTSGGKYLIEEGWAYHYLTGEQDLLEEALPRRDGPLLALGGIDYDRPEPKTPGAALAALSRGDLPAGSIAPPDRGADTDCGFLRLPFFEALPGSLEEVLDLVKLWDRLMDPGDDRWHETTLLTGVEATEASLLASIAGHRVLHIATHGFLFGDGCPLRRGGARGIGGLSFAAGLEARPRRRPLAGLALAGANRREAAVDSGQDGVLTEAEILNLDLDQVDWVVLSACDTGLGRLQPGEGVLGIRRAFQVAGARTLISSLWAIDDRATRDWMRDLYQARFGQGLSTVASVHRASLAALARQRALGDDNPVHWAGFVATGQWN